MSHDTAINICCRASRNMRKNILKLALKGGINGAHIAPALSAVDILSVLYLTQLKIPKEKTKNLDRDVFLLSKGHGALALYTALYEAGLISHELLYTYEDNGGSLPGQNAKKRELCLDFAGGSLGMGLSYGAGIAMSHKIRNCNHAVYVLMGDGECNEGSVWESAMFAAHNKLSCLTAIIDYNGMQSDGFSKDILTYNVAAMWQAVGWKVIECDGHDVAELMEVFSKSSEGSPKVVIAHTVKGKGISFMENNRAWHHSRITEEQVDQGIAELERRLDNDRV